ncbi:MAG: hypothetical protein WDW36_001399 [Sanguina aurantia]
MSRSLRDRKPISYKDPTVKEQEAAAEASREPVKHKTRSLNGLLAYSRGGAPPEYDHPQTASGAHTVAKPQPRSAPPPAAPRPPRKPKGQSRGFINDEDDGGATTSDYDSDADSEGPAPPPQRTSSPANRRGGSDGDYDDGDGRAGDDDDDGGDDGDDGDGVGGGDGEEVEDWHEDEAVLWDSSGARLEVQRIVGRVEGKAGMFSTKLVGKSYRELVPLSTLLLKQEKPQLLTLFLQSGGASRGFTGADPEWGDVERVIARRRVSTADRRARPTPGGPDTAVEYLVKWKGLEYAEATWFREDAMTDVDREAVARFAAVHAPRAAGYNRGGPSNALRAHETFPLPAFLNGRALRDYQESSVRWMVGNFCSRRSCILGDEMGLGKTAQSIALLESIRLVGSLPGPFLIVAPLTTLGHWQRELRTWTDMNVVLFSGDAEDRKVIIDHELFFPKNVKPRCKFDVLLVSYERLVMDKAMFWGIDFVAAVFDEAHKLKGFKSSVRAVVEQLNTYWKLMLTGTPIQNNMAELFSMMNMLNPQSYPHLEGFTKRFGGGGAVPTVEQIRSLQECLAPILLRRMKEDVEDLPEKEEVIIWVELTAEQRTYYKALYAGTICSLLGGKGAKNLPQMRNLAMELRKLCCHPFLCNGIQDDIWIRKNLAAQTSGQGPTDLELLTRASGKMVLLSKLLPKLRSEGKRVLIFSQFKIMLDQLENFLAASGYPSERIDGSTGTRERQQSIDKFSNGTDEECFVFLLSTRAGGMGITLTAADTCIIYDSDWNPQNDLQAMARCHRIGQTKEVKVYRLLTKDTYEEHLFQTASRKYGLDEAILGFSAGTDPETDSAHINELLKNGAHSLAVMDANESGEKFASEDIEQILSGRTEKRQIGAKAGNSFSVARFVTEEDTPDAGAPLDIPFNKIGKKWRAENDRAFWSEMMPEAVEEHDARIAAAMAPLERGARKGREKTINYRTTDKPVKTFGNPEVDLEYNFDEDEEEVSRKKRRKGAAPDGAAEAAAAAAAAVGKKWSKGDLRLVEDRLLALGPGRYGLMMTQLLKETATVGNKPLTGGKSFARSEAEVQTLCESIIAVINAADEVVRAAPGISGAAKGGSAAAAKEGREAGGVKREDRGGDGEEGEEGEGGGEKAGRGDVTLSAEAKEERELAMKAELNARVDQLQPVLKVGDSRTPENFNGRSAAATLLLSTLSVGMEEAHSAEVTNAPVEAGSALNNLETLRRILKNAAEYKLTLHTNRRVAELLMPLIGPDEATADGSASPVPVRKGVGVKSEHALAQDESAPSGAAFATFPTLSKIKTRLPAWWNNADDKRLLRAVVMQGFVPWAVTQWVRKTLTDTNEHGFGHRVTQLSSLPEVQRQAEQKKIDRVTASAAAAAAAVSAAAVAAATAANGGIEDAGAFAALAARPVPVPDFSEDSNGVVILRTDVAWNLLVAEVGKRVKALIALTMRGPVPDLHEAFAAGRSAKGPIPTANPRTRQPHRQQHPGQPAAARMPNAPHTTLHLGTRDNNGSDSEDERYDDSPTAPSMGGSHAGHPRNQPSAPTSPHRTQWQGPSVELAMHKLRTTAHHPSPHTQGHSNSHDTHDTQHHAPQQQQQQHQQQPRSGVSTWGQTNRQHDHPHTAGLLDAQNHNGRADSIGHGNGGTHTYSNLNGSGSDHHHHHHHHQQHNGTNSNAGQHSNAAQQQQQQANSGKNLGAPNRFSLASGSAHAPVSIPTKAVTRGPSSASTLFLASSSSGRGGAGNGQGGKGGGGGGGNMRQTKLSFGKAPAPAAATAAAPAQDEGDDPIVMDD